MKKWQKAFLFQTFATIQENQSSYEKAPKNTVHLPHVSEWQHL